MWLNVIACRREIAVASGQAGAKVEVMSESLSAAPPLLLKNVQIVNEGSTTPGDVLVRRGRIERIAPTISSDTGNAREIDGRGRHLLPGVIDDQVHFREPGLTHKAEIATESRAAVAGGVTSFMEMPNTNPQSVTIERLEEKYARAAAVSPANYSFYFGATNDNFEEVARVDGRRVCGVKVFMGSSTGNMLVDDEAVLDRLFANCPLLIATHCEHEPTVNANYEAAVARYGQAEAIPLDQHPVIRNEEACWRSSSHAVELARKNGTRLHVLHLTTARELALFDSDIPLAQKKITSEACVHHLTFCDEDYATLGAEIKCNPAVKRAEDRDALWAALLADTIDVVATDHAPHTRAEKDNPYPNCPSGLPLIQHTLRLMLEHHRSGRISLPDIARKMSHAPAELFGIEERGYIREGTMADLVLVDLDQRRDVSDDPIIMKCGWSPLAGRTLPTIALTLVNGRVVWEDGALRVDDRAPGGERLAFTPRS